MTSATPAQRTISAGRRSMAPFQIERAAGHLEIARRAVTRAGDVFYTGTGGWHHATWLYLQRAYLSFELGDYEEAVAREADARSALAEAGNPVGLAYCDALQTRLRAANAALT